MENVLIVNLVHVYVNKSNNNMNNLPKIWNAIYIYRNAANLYL